VETGGLLVPLSDRGVSTDTLLPIHKGLIWLLVATIAEALPVVSGRFHLHVLSTHRAVGTHLFEPER
jgi:hypothetical protein